MERPAQQEELFRWAIDALEMTVTVDAQGIIRHIGRTYANILQMDQASILGQPVEKVIPGTRMMEVIKSGQPEYGSIFVMKNDVPIVVNRFPIRDEEGSVRGAICVTSFTDIDTMDKLSKQINALRQENERYRSQLEAIVGRSFSLDSIVGDSPAMRRIKAMVEKVADSDITVLLTGETGTGKEVVASALHYLSIRRYGNFVKINCAAIPKELLESELFGYQGGAFSGASKTGKQGKFEQANNGTILLDEISEMPLEMQSKLLRVIQEKELVRVGGLTPFKLNVRILCSTNKDLQQLVKEGRFREDLYYRINVLECTLPPLRERKEDIPLLCNFLIHKINEHHGCDVQGIDQPVTKTFQQYDWPGNVRELKHVLERACILSRSGILKMDCFDFFLPRLVQEKKEQAVSMSLQDKKQQAEWEAITKALLEAGGNRTKAARSLGISRSLLYKKLYQYQSLS